MAELNLPSAAAAAAAAGEEDYEVLTSTAAGQAAGGLYAGLPSIAAGAPAPAGGPQTAAAAGAAAPAANVATAPQVTPNPVTAPPLQGLPSGINPVLAAGQAGFVGPITGPPPGYQGGPPANPPDVVPTAFMLQAQSLLQQQNALITNLQNSLSIAAANQSSQAQPYPKKFGDKCLPPAGLPSPADGWKHYKRQLDEFLATLVDTNYSTFQILRAVKDCLPPDLIEVIQAKWKVDQMTKAGCLDEIVDFLRDRFDTYEGADQIADIKNWDALYRKTQDVVAFMDLFEHHILLLAKQGITFSDAVLARYLIVKMRLPVDAERALMLALHRLRTNLALASYSYKHVKEEMQHLNANLFVRVNVSSVLPTGKDILASPPDHRPRDPYFVNYQGKGRDKGSNELYPVKDCFHWRDGQCWRGADCKFSHAGPGSGCPPSWDRGRSNHRGRSEPASRSRSRGDSSRSYRQDTSRSRGRSPSGGFGNIVCRDFQQYKCTRGKDCRFSHDFSTGGSRPSPPTRPAPTGSRSPSRERRHYPGKGKGKGKSRSPSRDARGSHGRSPRPPPRRK